MQEKRERREENSELKEKVVAINRVAKVVKGFNRSSYCWYNSTS